MWRGSAIAERVSGGVSREVIGTELVDAVDVDMGSALTDAPVSASAFQWIELVQVAVSADEKHIESLEEGLASSRLHSADSMLCSTMRSLPALAKAGTHPWKPAKYRGLTTCDQEIGLSLSRRRGKAPLSTSRSMERWRNGVSKTSWRSCANVALPELDAP
jgi:hypothetical protein